MKLALTIPYNPGRVVVATVGSALQYNLEIDRILWLRKTYGTDTEDQESAYAAGVATAMKILFITLRVISDSVFHDPVLDKTLGLRAAACALLLVRAIAHARMLHVQRR